MCTPVRSVAAPIEYSGFGEESPSGRCAQRCLQPETRSGLIVQAKWSDGRNSKHLSLLSFGIRRSSRRSRSVVCCRRAKVEMAEYDIRALYFILQNTLHFLGSGHFVFSPARRNLSFVCPIYLSLGLSSPRTISTRTACDARWKMIRSSRARTQHQWFCNFYFPMH